MPANSNTKKVKVFLVGASGKMGQMVATLAEKDPEVELSDVGDVVIDFSTPEGTRAAIALGKPLVSGTTGLSEEIFNELAALSKRVPVLHSPNFSLGIALCFEMLEQMSAKLKKFSQIEIQEIHHTQKVDAPSGTALKMAEILGVDKVHSERIGDVVGIHQVNFLFNNEKLSLRHEALSREAFAQGALVAAKFLFNKPPKLYSLGEVFH
ncbi:MAG: 4-hydroxy-tetrahydrodipicolinate reductase [Chlamydiae bacterium]|nr:4-hydroxy-tetrahydrodipicolinate reductase [Chlamydiota bacterium]